MLAASLPRPAVAQSSAEAPGTSAAVLPVEPVLPAPPFGAGLVQTAREYLGVPYVWGGETPRAFDCSGFVQWVFARRGVLMPRTAREQAGVGDAPYPGDLQVGDLLFFWGGEGAQHVAIYAGGDSIIHASSRSRRVQFDRMRGTGMQRDWFGQRLITVRRVIPATPSPHLGARVAPASRATILAGGYR